uniref:Uncharacterized protein n=1 Tax=Amphimedon queenslandica TaxID=400682 RepID=A0A1X7VWL1_AMPQE
MKSFYKVNRGRYLKFNSYNYVFTISQHFEYFLKHLSINCVDAFLLVHFVLV